MTYLTVPITVSSIEQIPTAVAEALSAGAGMVELRLDYLDSPSPRDVCTAVELAKKSSLPIIATCRAQWEGGEFAGEEDQRQLLLQQALKAGADYVDIELAAIKNKTVELDNDKLIISSHDFERASGDFHNLLEHKKIHGGKVVKCAYMAQKITDCFAALDMLHEQPGSIAMAMGEAGVITRLLASKLGAFLTFASLGEGKESAPGQVTVQEMKRLYRHDAITVDTKVYGVIGYPVGHSLSPALYNGVFDATGFNGVYLPLLVEPSREIFNGFIDGVRQRKWLDFQGFSVTIPHKGNALEYVKSNGGHVDTLSEKIGAVNTLVIDSNDQLSGYNTDYLGAMQAILEALGAQQNELKAMTVAVVGAGGVARSLVAGLTDVGAEVTIYNRTVERARKLADEFGCRWHGRSELQSLDAQLVINCTSIGMYPKVEDTPVCGQILKKDMVVFDTVYNPLETRLLREAKEKGAKTIDGLRMFVNQAVRQYEMLTGREVSKKIIDGVMAKYR